MPTDGQYIIINDFVLGLTAAAYLAKRGVKDVLVLERRHLVGGAAVTEELVRIVLFCC
jgi:ribulose 1,5-bisphosphate synthetase/thiazole synthase